MQMKIDKQVADSIISQLAGAKQLLAQGRAFGIRIVATAEAIEGLRQASHPDTDQAIANIKVDNGVSGHM